MILNKIKCVDKDLLWTSELLIIVIVNSNYYGIDTLC